MFKKKIGLFLFILSFLFFCSLMFLGVVTEKDRNSYRQLTENASLTNKNKNSLSHIKQQRYNVTKHFLRTNGDQRTQLFLKSLSSAIVINHPQTKAEVVEEFEDVKCMLQEALEKENNGSTKNIISSKNNSNQTIRQFNAVKATYFYKTEELMAEDVDIVRYLAQGKEFNLALQPTKILMKGKASKVELSLSNQEKPFKAHNFQAIVQDWGKKL